MKCPSCGAEVPADQLGVEILAGEETVESRRISRFAACACGVDLNLGAWERWERWYIKAWRKVSAGIDWTKSDESDAYYEREKFQRLPRGQA